MSLDSSQKIPSTIEQTVRCVLGKDFNTARRIIANIDYATIAEERIKVRTSVWSTSRQRTPGPVNKTRRVAVPAVRKLKVFRRDHFTCRYAHCNRRTIYIPVIKELSRLFPDLLPYKSNWNPVPEHLLYWVLGASLEHKLSFPHGGDSSEANLITACYCCNDAKNYLHLSDLAWEVTEIADSDWDGLERFLAPLTKITATLARPGSGNQLRERNRRNDSDLLEMQPTSITPGSLIRARLPGKRSIRQYRVDEVFLSPKPIWDSQLQGDNESPAQHTVIIVREMWRTSADRTWVMSKRSRSFQLHELSGVSEVSKIAPKCGTCEEK